MKIRLPQAHNGSTTNNDKDHMNAMYLRGMDNSALAVTAVWWQIET